MTAFLSTDEGFYFVMAALVLLILAMIILERILTKSVVKDEQKKTDQDLCES